MDYRRKYVRLDARVYVVSLQEVIGNAKTKSLRYSCDR